MRRRSVAAVAAAGALAVGGTAAAAPGGGPFGVFGGPEERQEELAGDLADKLGGDVTRGEVDRALDQIRDERESQHRKQEAAAIAAELDGVSAAEVEKALEKVHAQARRSFRSSRPAAVDVAAALAKELGESKADVEKALRAANQKRHEADRIRERKEDGPPFGRGDHLRHRGPGGPGGPPPGGPPPFGP